MNIEFLYHFITSRMFNAKNILLILWSILSITFWPISHAQNLGNKTIRLIIASAPGGGTDAIGRLVAEALSNTLNQQVIAENKAGASGIIASEILTKSPADGSTLMIIQNSHAMNPAFYKKLPYNTLKDFTPISTLAKAPLVMVSSNLSGVKNIKELIELGKKDPSTLNFASSEASARLAIQLISSSIKMPVAVASYKGTGPAVIDVASGHVNYTITTISSTLSQKSTGRLNYLVLMSNQRSSLLPEVPSIAESGYPDQEVTGWWGILGPPNMSKILVSELNRNIKKAMSSNENMTRLNFLAVEPWFSSPEEFDEFIHKEVKKTLILAKEAGLESE